MLQEFWQQAQNPVVYAIPFFAVLIGVEAAALRADHASEFRGYQLRDARTSVAIGLGSLVFMFVFKLATIAVFVCIWTYLAPWHIPTDTWWSWALLLVVVDLTWYCNHRFSHRVRIGWAAHRAHHSSEYFNLSTALRLKWNPWSEAIFWAPLPLVGFAPWSIYVAYGFIMIYQFWLHTETIGKLPRPIEFVFNTPSHHRVHHSSEPECCGKNYGGFLILWDRMFSSFLPESHTPEYGLATPIETNSVLKLQYGGYAGIISDVRHAKILRHKLAYILGPPGWRPRLTADQATLPALTLRMLDDRFAEPSAH